MTAFRSASQSASAYLVNPVVTKPAGVVAGDLLIASASWLDNGGIGFAWPAGWTALSDYWISIQSHRHAVRYRIADGSEPSSYTFTMTGSGDREGHVIILAFSDPQTPSPISGNSGMTEVTASATDVVVQSVITQNVADLLLVFISGMPTANMTFDPASSGYTEQIEGGSTGGGVDAAAFTKIPAGVLGATGTKTFGAAPAVAGRKVIPIHIAIAGAPAASVFVPKIVSMY